MRTRPHAVNPQHDTIRIVLVYKNFALLGGCSHIGLGVSALNAMKELRAHGIHAEVWPILSDRELDQKLKDAEGRAAHLGEIPVSHVVISAPWIPIHQLSDLVARHSQIHFAVTCHSNVGFLQADPRGTELFRGCMELQEAWPNFSAAGNSLKFVEWIWRAYGTRIAYLPNLYHLEDTSRVPERPHWRGGKLKIGSFGALRLLKNHLSSAAAAIEISRRLGVETEFWISDGRYEGGGRPRVVLDSIKALVKDVPDFKLVQNGWQSWTSFRRTVRSMNLLLQPSFTESFNMVTADGAAMGVASVTSEAIEWSPRSWKAEPDDALDIANRGIALLQDCEAAREGRIALQCHNDRGVVAWRRFLLPRINQF